MNIDPEVIELKKLLEENNLSREQLIDIGILIGTDFNPNGIRGIGPITALKYIKKYGKLENINELKERIQEIEYEQIREIFLRPKITEPGDIKWNNIKKDKLDIKLVSTIDEALELALTKKPDAIEWDEKAWLAEQKNIKNDPSSFTSH